MQFQGIGMLVSCQQFRILVERPIVIPPPRFLAKTKAIIQIASWE